jgi:hypothetical protein
MPIIHAALSDHKIATFSNPIKEFAANESDYKWMIGFQMAIAFVMLIWLIFISVKYGII